MSFRSIPASETNESTHIGKRKILIYKEKRKFEFIFFKKIQVHVFNFYLVMKIKMMMMKNINHMIYLLN